MNSMCHLVSIMPRSVLECFSNSHLQISLGRHFHPRDVIMITNTRRYTLHHNQSNLTCHIHSIRDCYIRSCHQASKDVKKGNPIPVRFVISNRTYDMYTLASIMSCPHNNSTKYPYITNTISHSNQIKHQYKLTLHLPTHILDISVNIPS